MLELDHVTIAYGETQAVEDFSLHMEPGEIVSLVGESGSGKTSRDPWDPGAVAGRRRCYPGEYCI